MSRYSASILILLLMLTVTARAQVTSSVPDVRILSEFGGIATPQQAQETFNKASDTLLAEGGGVLVIPAGAPSGWDPQNSSQTAWRDPKPPAPAKHWGIGPGVTVLDYRGGTVQVDLPALTGMDVVRVMRMPEGSSSPHWEYHPALHVINSIIRGTTSYREWVLDDIEAGTDRRFYVRTIRGVFPGMFLNAGDTGTQRLYVKDLGFDSEKKLPFFVADTDAPIRKSSLVHNKTHANALRIDTFAHTENQTFDIMNWRRMYSQGDTYLFDARFDYMSDIHSTAGDENGVLYAAFVRGMTDIFRGKVAAWDPVKRELMYTAPSNAHSLGSGRPIVNLNTNKWISQGSCFILPPGGAIIGWGSNIRSTDAPWTDAIVGRYFAVDEPDEYVPNGTKLRRWWYITAFSEKGGVKMLSIQRHWWGAKDTASITTLYNPANFTADPEKPKRLRYVIAPGANVYDVADGVPPDPGSGKRSVAQILRITPGPHVGTPVDFEPGDPIEQAIGPDPFRPVPFRSWLFENVPGAWPAPVFDIANHGAISRHAVMTVAGGNGDAKEDREKRADKRPPWDNLLFFSSACQNGLVFAGDTTEAAIHFRQPHGRVQPIQWSYGLNGRAALTVDPTDGTLTYSAPAGMALPGGVKRTAGISATATPAHNLRGIGVEVPAGTRRHDIRFRVPEQDDQYAVFVELSWITEKAVVEQTAEGFSVEFSVPPEGKGRLHWMLVR